MINDLHIIHRLKPRRFEAAEAEVAPGIMKGSQEAMIWATCLRSLAFSSQAQAAFKQNLGFEAAYDQLYSHSEAYSFLLEVICGLHSPILGETEVFGQFKKFANHWLKASPHRQPLVQRLLTDAKELRTQYLSRIGSQSYGGWIKKNVKSQTINVLGRGQLVQEMLPYLEKPPRQLHLHVRDLNLAFDRSARISKIDERNFSKGALLICAPVSAQFVYSWLGDFVPSEIVDLRDNSREDSLQPYFDFRVVHLNDIFSELEQNKTKLKPVVEQVKNQIKVMSEKVSQQGLVRPLGWDDLCA